MTNPKYRSAYDSPYSVKNTGIKTKSTNNRFKDPELLAFADLLTNKRCDPDSTGIIRALMNNNKSRSDKLQCLSSYKIQQLELLAKYLHLPTRCNPPNPSQKNQKPIKMYRLKEDLVKDLMKVIDSHLYQTCQTCLADYKVELDGEDPLLSCLICSRGCHNLCERASLSYNTNLSASRRDLFICNKCYLENAETTKISKVSTKPKDPILSIEDPIIPLSIQAESYKTPISTPTMPRTRNDVTLEDSLFSPSPPSQPQPANLPSLSQIPLPEPMNPIELQRHSPPNLISLLHDVEAAAGTSSDVAKSKSPSASPGNYIQKPPAPDNCPDYIRGCCPHGISGRNCSLPHRKRCNRFCRNGPHPRYGCTKDTDCLFFHPELCKFSVRNRVCLNLSCVFTHLKFTRRLEYTNSKHLPAAPNRTANPHDPPKTYHPPAPVYKAPHIAHQRTSNWDPLMDPLNEQPRKIEDEQDFAQRSQFPKLELIKEEMRQEMKIWQKSILAPMQRKLEELTLLLKQRQPGLPTLFPHPTTSSAPHPNAMLYNIPPQSWYPRPLNQNTMMPQCQMTSTPNQSNPQLLNQKLPQHQAFPHFSC